MRPPAERPPGDRLGSVTPRHPAYSSAVPNEGWPFGRAEKQSSMVELFPGESVIRSGSVAWAGRPGIAPGTLTLTNRAMIYEGPLPAGPAGVRRIPLWRCRLARSSPGPAGGPRLELDLLQQSIYFRTPEADAWAQAINLARASAPPPPPGAGAGAGGGVPNIAAARAAMPKCAYCGGLNAPMATRCKSCGAPLS